jgi:hypothetical protein
MHILNYYLNRRTHQTKPNQTNHKNGWELDTSLLEYMYAPVICERDTSNYFHNISHIISIVEFICLIEKEENAIETFIQLKK